VQDEGGGAYVASPFGVRTMHETFAETIDFARLGRDPDLGTIRMGVRDYDPRLSQFWTPDPLYLENPERCQGSPVECGLYGYAGKADLFGFLRGRRRLVAIDWKTGAVAAATGLQLAGYSGAWLEMTGEAVIDRMGVELTPGGTKPYKIHPFEDRGDLAVFRGAAAGTNWRRKHLAKAA
jgi:RHS repeat-associated protein